MEFHFRVCGRVREHVEESGLAQDVDLCNIAGNTISIPTVGSVLATVLSGWVGHFRIHLCYLSGVSLCLAFIEAYFTTPDFKTCWCAGVRFLPLGSPLGRRESQGDMQNDSGEVIRIGESCAGKQCSKFDTVKC